LSRRKKPSTASRDARLGFDGVRLTILSGHGSITLAAFDRVEVYTTDHHRQRHGIDLHAERSGVVAAGYLETPTF
jgi:hypothetical protein